MKVVDSQAHHLCVLYHVCIKPFFGDVVISQRWKRININCNKAGVLGNFSLGGRGRGGVILTSLHISRRTYLISI